MSIIDAIKDSVLAQTTSALTVPQILLSLLVAFVCALYIAFIYRKTFSGIVYNRSYVLTLFLLTLVTAMIIRTINSNLSLSLGMVGALSIVRFRTAIKEPVDTAFMFWGITAGIMSGAGLYLIALAGTLFLGILFYIVYTTNVKASSQYLLVVSYSLGAEEAVDSLINSIKKSKFKSKVSLSKDTLEVTYEVQMDDDSIVNKLQNLEGVKHVSLITFQNEIGL